MMTHYIFNAPFRVACGGGLIMDWNVKVSREELPPTIDYCSQCKFAVDVSTKLYTCDGDHEDVIYCSKHDVICRALRPACDWAAVSEKV